jgi:hypothetical protein
MLLRQRPRRSQAMKEGAYTFRGRIIVSMHCALISFHLEPIPLAFNAPMRLAGRIPFALAIPTPVADPLALPLTLCEMSPCTTPRYRIPPSIAA